ncbi:hypothetical protein [Natronobiforma cellulositropha]|uniref:hypothetical protein n=1 Tax=Natronobiforma cellulositropha TaxID=1679076 RepID=UPI0021D5AB7D|nr:hypothetical protein [Natronobiforma cellulositropha]
MAREPAVADESAAAAPTEQKRTDDGNTGLLHRREYLKLAGVATVAAAGAGAVGAASADEYEVITVPAGQRRVIRVGSNETFENVLFDQTAPGSAVTVVAHGTNWTIRNVAWRGEFSHHDRAIAVSDTGNGTSRVENVYMGDGVDDSVGNRRHPKFGLWVSPEHNGRLEIERMYVEGANDNAFYGSAPGTNSNGRRGTIHYKNCYAKDNRVSGFRLAGGTVENCVAVNTNSGNNGRPLWVWPTRGGLDVEVRDCHFVCGNYAHGYDFGRNGATTNARVIDSHYAPASSTRFLGTVNLEEDNVGHSPRDFVPEGCPDSPEAVFDGMTDPGEPREDPSEYREHTLVFRADHQGDDWERSEYSFEIDGELEASTYDGASIDPELDLEEGQTSVSHTLANWRDAYAFDGDLVALEVDGPARVYLDGEEIDPAEFGDEDDGDGGDGGDGEDGNDGNDGEDGGDGSDGEDGGDGSDGEDGDDGTDGEDGGDGGEDGDEETGDPSEYREHTLLLRADHQGADWERTEYVVEVDGELEPSEFDGASIDPELAFEDGQTRVEHTLANWRDAFAFDGDLVGLEIDGPARVYLDGERIDPETYFDDEDEDRDPAEYREHTLLLRGDHQGRNWEPTRYSVEVDGELEPSEYDGASIDPGLDLEEGATSVTHTLANWKDAYAFDGDLVALEVDGPARVYLDDERIDPETYFDDEDDLENLLVIEGSDAGVTRYEFVVGGEVETSNEDGDRLEDAAIEGSRVHGVVGDWTEAFRFSGDLEGLSVHGPATVSLNGERIDPADYGEHLPHLLEVVGRGHPSSFQVTIDGAVEYAGDGTPEDEGIVMGDGVIESTVSDGRQRFAFSGALTDVTFVDSEADVYVDGERIDPYEYGDQLLLPHAIVIDGTDAEGESTYSFTVDGEVLKAEHMGATIDPDDVIEGTAVEGTVDDRLDAYWFNGDITNFRLTGDAAVHLEYNARNR